ncbi:ornithine carbamoyltransferase [Physocladia obscura]|uniref:ornithine carbamoyltransferase n=1 Tax=Physocladia obscura TaxID=109957 RepID=A0AAD5T8U5_9FUNG|nr:ornithine carbamoyltransferase [Physocladia obscura]
MTLHNNPTKHFLTLKTQTPSAILALVHRSLMFKHHKYHGDGKTVVPASAVNQLAGKTLALLFTKKSTRTRISGEAAWAALGGHAMFLGAGDIQLGDVAKGGESWRDTSTVVGSMADAVFARLGAHSELEELAAYSAAPVVNALTAKFHPMQALADIMTLYEAVLGPAAVASLVATNKPLPPLAGVTVAWVGDANNIINSLLVSLPRIGVNVAVATPVGYDIDDDIQDFVAAEAAAPSPYPYGSVTYTRDPRVAVRNADFIVTDTWVSMGQEAEKSAKLRAFAGYKVTEAMARDGGAKSDWHFMHCLPRKLEEVDDEVFYSKRSLVFPEAENRKWTAMAVFEHVSGNNPANI